jgi:hypothetical protein
MECIDFDEPCKYDEWRELLDENGHDDLTAMLVIERTPRGGAHVYYRCPGGIEGNQKLALRFTTEEEQRLKPAEKAKAMIETRGEGGLVVCQPTSGYTPLQGKLSQIPTISTSQRDMLIHAARSLNEVVEQRAETLRRESTADPSNKPGADFNARASWFDVLVNLGWSHVFASRGRDYWRRPGKDDAGISATTGNGDDDLLYVFSTSCYPLEAERCYSKFAVYAYCKHNGDFSGAAKDLLSMGYGDKIDRQSHTDRLPETSSAEPGTADVQRRWVRVPYSELLARPKKPMLIDDLIGERDSCMIFGKPKSGKTFVVIDLLLSAVCGGTFAGVFNATRPLVVAYMTNEGLGSLAGRIRANALHNEVPYDDISKNLFIYEDVPQLYSNEGPESITKFVDEWLEFESDPLDLLVIDTLNKATLGADENDNSDAALVSRNLFLARKRLGCATCVIHHTGKNGDSVRGASGYDGDMDIQLKVTKEESTGIRYLSMTLAKDLTDFEDIGFKLSPVDDTVAVSWLGSKEISTDQSALMRVVTVMRNNPSKEWWSISQLREFVSDCTRDAIRVALSREVQKPVNDSLIKAWLDCDGRGTAMYGVRT